MIFPDKKKKKKDVSEKLFKEDVLTKLHISKDPKGQLETSVLGYIKEDFKKFQTLALIGSIFYVISILLLLLASRLFIVASGIYTLRAKWFFTLNIPIIMLSWVSIGSLDIILIVIITLHYLVLFYTIKGQIVTRALVGLFIIFVIINGILHLVWIGFQFPSFWDCETVFPIPILEIFAKCGWKNLWGLVLYQIILVLKILVNLIFTLLIVYQILAAEWFFKMGDQEKIALSVKKNSTVAKHLFKKQSVRNKLYQLAIDLKHIEEVEDIKNIEMNENVGETRQTVSLLKSQ